MSSSIDVGEGFARLPDTWPLRKGIDEILYKKGFYRSEQWYPADGLNGVPLVNSWSPEMYAAARCRIEDWPSELGPCPAKKLPRAGEWWQSKDDADRVYICGFDHQGDPVYSHAEGAYVDTIEMKYFLDGYEYLPDCTGWDWEPEPAETYPKWYTSAGGRVFRRDSETESVYFAEDGEIRPQKSTSSRLIKNDTDTFREVTEAEAKALLPVRHRQVERVTMYRIMARTSQGVWFQFKKSSPEKNSYGGYQFDRWHVIESFEVEIPC
jgi:hypothetical protein